MMQMLVALLTTDLSSLESRQELALENPIERLVGMSGQKRTRCAIAGDARAQTVVELAGGHVARQRAAILETLRDAGLAIEIIVARVSYDVRLALLGRFDDAVSVVARSPR